MASSTVWNMMKNSYNSQGLYDPSLNLSYNPKGPKTAFKNAFPGMSRPREGMLGSIRRAGYELIGREQTGGLIMSGGSIPMRSAQNIRYGGGLFTSGGLREITHEASQVPGSAMWKLGAKRSTRGMLKKAAGKALFGPGASLAFFAYTASNEGIGQAVVDTAATTAIWGAGRWAATQLGLGMATIAPLAIATGAVVGGRAALIAGREYNRSIRKANFGNANADIYGQVATVRQASINAIQSSRINGRNSLGHEANLMHA